MKRVIYKYQLQEEVGQHIVLLPPKSTILYFDKDVNGFMCIWVEQTIPSEHQQELEGYIFNMIWTGHEVPENHIYIGTIVGHLVWHLYKEMKEN